MFQAAPRTCAAASLHRNSASSPSCSMFRKAVGKPPARYLAERNASGQPLGGAISM